MTMKYVLFLVLFAAQAVGQLAGNAQLVLFPGAPSGSCTSRQLALNQSNGSLSICHNGAWQSAGAGGAALLGCSTPTSGNLVCDLSVQGGTGPSGLVTVPYSGTTLPSPPATASLAAITANSNGVFFSPGNGAAFQQVGAGGGGGGPSSGAATHLTFGVNSIPLSSTSPSSGQILVFDGTNISGVDPSTIGGGPSSGGCNCGGVTIVE